MTRGMAGMVLFIASEIMLFGGLFAGYFYVRNQAALGRLRACTSSKPGSAAS